jgi:hypothetical protein
MSTIEQTPERQRVEQAIEKTARKTTQTHWSHLTSSLQEELSGPAGQAYKVVGQAFQQAERQADDRAKMAIATLPAPVQASALEVAAQIARVAESQGPQTAQQVASFLCAAYKASAQAPSQV